MQTHGSFLECRITIILRQPWEELVPWKRTQWHWSKQVQFGPSWLFHKGCLSLHSWQTAILPHVGKLNPAYSAFSNFHSTFIRAMGSVWFSCPVKFFHLKIAIGLALGESWLLLVQPHKNTDVQCLPFPICVGRLSLANLQKSPSSKQGCKHMDQI